MRRGCPPTLGRMVYAQRLSSHLRRGTLCAEAVLPPKGVPQGVPCCICLPTVSLRVYTAVYASLLYTLGFRPLLTKRVNNIGNSWEE